MTTFLKGLLALRPAAVTNPDTFYWASDLPADEDMFFSDGQSWVRMDQQPFTVLEQVAISGVAGLSDALENFAQLDHTHAWAEVTSKPATFPPDSHSHAYADITSKPSTFAPSTHSHPTSEVTGLDTALLGKASSSHTHAQADITNLSADLAGKAAATAVPNASYRTILDCSGSHIAGRVAGTYGLAQSQPIAISGTGTLYPLNTVYIAAADYPTLNGVAAKLRVRAQLYVNDAAPTGNFTFGLHPITRPATSGAAGLLVYTIGAAVAGSTVVQNTPATDSSNVLVGTDFALPADGHYVLGVVTTATVATASLLHISALCQMRNA